MRLKKVLFLGTLCTAVSGMSLFAQAGVSYAKSAKETTEASSEEAAETESEEETSEEVTYPIVIEHAFGETVIESKPERIATVGWGNQDTPLALGIAPVGVSAANYGLVTDHQLHLWTDQLCWSDGTSSVSHGTWTGHEKDSSDVSHRRRSSSIF